MCCSRMVFSGIAGETQAAPCSGANIGVSRASSPVFYVDTRNNSQPAAYAAYSITNSTGSSIEDLWVSASGFSGGSVTYATNKNGVSHVGPLANGATKTVRGRRLDDDQHRGRHGSRYYDGD
jgi:hypothetical protein